MVSSKRLIIGVNATEQLVKRRMKEWSQVKISPTLDMLDWIDNNLEGLWIWSGFYCSFYFELKEDEVMFKLTWQ